MMIKKLNIYMFYSLTVFSTSGCSATKEPDYYSHKGYCVVNTIEQKAIGLNRFNTTKEFKEKCNSKMIFKFEKDECRLFTMKDMKFNIYIKDKNTDQQFKIKEKKLMCGKTVIEYVK